MSKTKPKALVLMLSLVLVLGIGGCNREKTKQDASANKSENNTSNQSSQKNAGPPAHKSSLHLSPDEYSRENPFLSLLKTNNEPVQQGNKAKECKTKCRNTKKEKPIRKVRICLIGIIGEDKAFFDEDGSTKIVSIGDVVAEMKVLEIRDGKVILGKDNIKHELKPGDQLKAKVIAED